VGAPLPRWPRRWLLTDLLPWTAALVAAVLLLGLAWRGIGGRAPSWPLVAALVLVPAYHHALRALARASWDERGEASAGAALRRDALRAVPSVLVRAAAFALVPLLSMGRPLAESAATGLALSLAVGLVWLVRQTAIVETVKGEEFGDTLEPRGREQV
jgi:hypothetical protein